MGKKRCFSVLFALHSLPFLSGSGSEIVFKYHANITPAATVLWENKEKKNNFREGYVGPLDHTKSLLCS